MFKITIDNEEVITDKDFTIEEEMLNTPSVILNNVYPKEWETEKDYLNFYHPNEYSKCKIYDEEITPASEGSTVEGTDFSITYDDTKEFSLLSLKGETSQTTTTGKNLLQITSTTQTVNGVTFTLLPDGTIKANGTAGTNGINYYVNSSFNLEAGTYTLSDDVNATDTTYFTYANGIGLETRPGIHTKTITQTTNCAVRIVVRQGVTLNNVIFKPMIEKSSSATTFEKYTGGIASPNPSYPQEVQTISGRQQISIMGKNLFDKDSNIVNGKTYTNTGALTNLSNCSIQESYIKVNSNWDYTLSTTRDYSSETDFRLIICEYDKDKNFIKRNIGTRGGGVTTEYSITTENNTRFVRLGFTTATIKELLFKSGTSGSYDVYRGNIYEINLGKNLFNKNAGNILNAYFNASTTTITNNGANRMIYIPCKPNTTYTLSKIRSAQFNIGYTKELPAANVQVYGINTSPTFYNDNTYYYFTITTPADAKYIVSRIYQTAQDTTITLEEVLNTIQLEKGIDVTSYSPYKEPIELCKIGNYQDYIRKSQGVNLFNDFTRTLNDNQYGYREGNTYISLSRNGSACWYFKMLVNPNEVFTISYSNRQTMDFKYRFSNEDMDDSSTIATYVNNGTNITQSGQVITNTNYKYFYMTLRYTYNASPARGSISDIQLEKGSQASPYEPYDSKGQWYLYKATNKVVLDGSENWDIFNNSFFATIDNNYSREQTTICISNYYRGANNVNGGAGAYNNGNNTIEFYYPSSLSRIYLRDDRYSSVNDYKTWLSSHNVEVYYVLDTPTTELIEDTDLLNQLDAISLLNGINYITVSSPNLVVPLKIHYNFNEEVINQELYFCGVVKNSGNISLNPREPHFQSLQVLSYKTFLSEGETLDFVIYEKTIREAIEQVVSAISDYGFIVGDINILNPDEIIGAYSTKDKSAYDVFQYIADITQSRWTTRMIDEDTIAIDFYDPTLMELGTTIDYTKEFFEENLIDNMFYSYGTNDYRNKQVMTSQQVYSNINQTQNIVANGYQTQFNTEQNIGKINSILVDNVSYSFATNTEKEMGVSADFYYSAGNNYIESASTISVGKVITIDYLPIVEGRQIITNAYEIDRVANSTGVKGVVARYENRNDATTSTELQLIGQSYIKYKGTPEIILTVVSRKDLWNVGQRVPFNAPIDELATEYMVRKKAINRITTIDTLFYTYELTSSFNSETAVNYFDNQRAKANGNIGDGEYISRNIDIESQARIIFYDSSATVITTTGDNKLNCTLESPFVE